jgi:hypothetical protein
MRGGESVRVAGEVVVMLVREVPRRHVLVHFGNARRNGPRPSENGGWRKGLAQIGLDAVANVADEVFVGAPVAEGGPPGFGCRRTLHGAGGDGVVFEFTFFDAAVADKGAEDESVGGGGGEEEFDGGVEGAGLLAAVGAEDLRDAVEGDGYHYEGEGEEEDELDFAFGGVLAAEDDGDGEEDEEEVGDDVAHGHGEELGVPLTALTAGVREDLPVVGKGAALGEVADDDGDEGCGEGAADEQQADVVGPLPGYVQTLEKLEDGVLQGPQATLGETLSAGVLGPKTADAGMVRGTTDWWRRVTYVAA